MRFIPKSVRAGAAEGQGAPCCWHLRPNDLSRLDLAFFNVNGYIAVLLFVATGADLASRWSGWSGL